MKILKWIIFLLSMLIATGSLWRFITYPSEDFQWPELLFAITFFITAGTVMKSIKKEKLKENQE